MLPTRKTGVSPWERWWRIRVPLAERIRHLRVWGCAAYLHVPTALRRKLDDKARRCILVGHSDTTKGYLLLDPRTGRFLLGTSVLFDETRRPFAEGYSPGLSDSADVSIPLDWAVGSGVSPDGEVDASATPAVECPPSPVLPAPLVPSSPLSSLPDPASPRPLPSPAGAAPPPPPALAPLYEVASVTGHRLRQLYEDDEATLQPHLTEQVKVRWKGYSAKDSTWEAVDDVRIQAPSVVSAYYDKNHAAIERRRAPFRGQGRIVGVDFFPPSPETLELEPGPGAASLPTIAEPSEPTPDAPASAVPVAADSPPPAAASALVSGLRARATALLARAALPSSRPSVSASELLPLLPDVPRSSSCGAVAFRVARSLEVGSPFISQSRLRRVAARIKLLELAATAPRPSSPAAGRLGPLPTLPSSLRFMTMCRAPSPQLCRA